MPDEKILKLSNFCIQILCLFMAVVLAVKYSQVSWHHMMKTDLGVYLRAGRVLAESGNIYQENPTIALPENATSYFPYIYTPLVAVFCYGLSFLGKPAVIVVWLSLTFFSLWFSSQFLKRSSNKSELSIGYPLLVLLLFPPTVDGWFFGQVNPFVLFFIAAGHTALLQSKNRRAGTFLAMASLIKISPVVLVVTLLRFKKWDALLYFFLTTLVVVICCSFTPRGPEIWLDFANALPDISSASFLFTIPVNFSVSHALFQLGLGFSQKSAINVVYLCALPVLYSLLFSNSFQSKNGLSYHLGAVICVMLLTSPILWPHHLLWILIPIVILEQSKARAIIGSAYVIGGALSVFLFIECIGRHSGNHWLTSEKTICSVGIATAIVSLLVIILVGARIQEQSLEGEKRF